MHWKNWPYQKYQYVIYFQQVADRAICHFKFLWSHSWPPYCGGRRRQGGKHVLAGFRREGCSALLGESFIININTIWARPCQAGTMKQRLAARDTNIWLDAAIQALVRAFLGRPASWMGELYRCAPKTMPRRWCAPTCERVGVQVYEHRGYCKVILIKMTGPRPDGLIKSSRFLAVFFFKWFTRDPADILWRYGIFVRPLYLNRLVNV